MTAPSFQLFPANAVQTILGGFFDIVTPNLPIVLAVLGVFLGIRFIMSRMKSATKGKA